MNDRREWLRNRVALPIRYAPLTPEETQLLMQGDGNLLLENSAPVFPPGVQTVTYGSQPTEQESLLLPYLQLLDLKLNWIIQRLGEEEASLQFEGETIDLCGNGLAFVASEPLPLGTLLRIRLQLPYLIPLSVNLIAEVLRIKPMINGRQDNITYSVAVQFIEIEEAQQELIVKFIFSQNRLELRRRKRKENAGS